MLRNVLYDAGLVMVGAYSRFMLDVEVCRLAEHTSGPKIIAINHPTTTDPFIVLPAFPERISLLILSSCFRPSAFGAYLRAAGHVPVVVESGRAAFDEARRRLENGETIGIFPEGVLSPASGLGRPRNGAARLALATGAPVQPVGIALQRELVRVLPTTITGAPDIAKVYLRGPYAITVGGLVEYAGDVDDRERVLAVSDEIMRRIGELARESDRRVRLMVEARRQRTLPALLDVVARAACRAAAVVR